MIEIDRVRELLEELTEVCEGIGKARKRYMLAELRYRRDAITAELLALYDGKEQGK